MTVWESPVAARAVAAGITPELKTANVSANRILNVDTSFFICGTFRTWLVISFFRIFVVYHLIIGAGAGYVNKIFHSSLQVEKYPSW